MLICSIRIRRFRYRQGNDGSVEPALHHLLDQLRRQRLANVNVEFRMQAREVFDHRRQQIGRNRRNHADAQAARQPVARGAREIAKFIDRAQDFADALDDFLAEFRQCDLSRAAFQQHAAQRLLHFLDLHRQRRLRDRASVRSASKMAMARQRVEVAELSHAYLQHQNILSYRSLKSTSPDGKRCLDCFQF